MYLTLNTIPPILQTFCAVSPLTRCWFDWRMWTAVVFVSNLSSSDINLPFQLYKETKNAFKTLKIIKSDTKFSKIACSCSHYFTHYGTNIFNTNHKSFCVYCRKFGWMRLVILSSDHLKSEPFLWGYGWTSASSSCFSRPRFSLQNQRSLCVVPWRTVNQRSLCVLPWWTVNQRSLRVLPWRIVNQRSLRVLPWRTVNQRSLRVALRPPNDTVNNDLLQHSV